MAKELSIYMKKRAKALALFMKTDYPVIVKVSSLNHFKQSFIDEGFTDSTLKKWQKRSTTDKAGNSNILYKTNRRGRAGTLNRKGRMNEGRPVLTGYRSAGNKLRNSLKAKIEAKRVIIYTYKKYAKRHNEGEAGMPERPFMDSSRKLDNLIGKKIEKELNKIFN